jgi:hypothetical protein
MPADDESYSLKRVLNATNPAELHAAAKSLSRLRDATNHTVASYLQKGDQIYQAHVKAGKMKWCVILLDY